MWKREGMKTLDKISAPLSFKAPVSVVVFLWVFSVVTNRFEFSEVLLKHFSFNLMRLV